MSLFLCTSLQKKNDSAVRLSTENLRIYDEEQDTKNTKKELLKDFVNVSIVEDKDIDMRDAQKAQGNVYIYILFIGSLPCFHYIGYLFTT